MKHLTSILSLVLFCLITVMATVWADEVSTASLQIKHVSLYKNGLGFFEAHVNLPNGKKMVEVGQIPVPSFGTFLAVFPETLKIKNLIAFMKELEENVPARSIAHILSLNSGKKVVLYSGVQKEEFISGTVLSEEVEQPIQAQPNPYLMNSRFTSSLFPSPYSVGPQDNVLLLKTASGTEIINPQMVNRVKFETEDIVCASKKKTKQPMLRMELEKAANNEQVKIRFLAKGISWIPNYSIDLTDSQTAKFIANAVIINEVADLENISLDLITGFPNIRFGEVQDPIAMTQALREFLGSLARGGSSNNQQSPMMQQRMVMNTMPTGLATYDSQEASQNFPSSGKTSEDLFFYPVTNVSIKKNETAYIPMFSAMMPYRHVYTWKIPHVLEKNPHSGYSRPNGPEDTSEEVWHSCKLSNTLSMPLTTAATTFTSDGMFIGQDICFYTPPGFETTIPINKALNVVAEQAEYETERVRDASKFNGYSHDLVKVKGELKVRNHVGKKIHMVITKELEGEIKECKPSGKDVQPAQGLKQVNTRHILTWELDLDPGKEESVKYFYEIYLRN